MPSERVPERARFRVPDIDQSVVSAGDQTIPVLAPSKSRRRAVVSGVNRGDWRPSVRVPDSDPLVGAGRGELPAIGFPRHRGHNMIVGLDRVQQLPLVGIPDLHSAAGTLTGDEEFPSGVPGE